MSQPPYMLINQQQQQMGQPSSSSYPIRAPPFPVPSSSSQNPTTNQSGWASSSSTSASGSGQTSTSFRAPAHKHAHHLHSIPPREKSTRTLIIDHMLWVHGRTRFAQARAELGMTDRTGGPDHPNYTHRRRPENYEEEDEQLSEGEDAAFVLKARSGGPGHPHDDDEETRLSHQDLPLARSLRLRAEGLEKVVTSMLEQPPPIHPINDEDILTPPTSPKLNPSNVRDPKHPHTLPNGVRLRLALGTIINDLFARQAPPPPYRHTHPNTTSSSNNSGGKVGTPPDSSRHSLSPSVSLSTSGAAFLPEALTPLAEISGAFALIPPPAQTPSMMSPPGMTYPPRMQHQQYQHLQRMSSNSPSPGLTSPYPNPPSSNLSSTPAQPSSSRPPIPTPTARVRTLYVSGADPSTANSPPAFRCPRHLHTGCEICVEAKSPTKTAGGRDGRRGAVSSPERGYSFGSGGSSYGAGGSYSAGYAGNSWKAMPGGLGPGGGGITGWQDGSGVGSGLLRPSVKGSALRRKVSGGDEKNNADESDADGRGRDGGGKGKNTGAGNTKLSKVIPRFIRLSALVAKELGREAGEGEEEGSEGGERRRSVSFSGRGRERSTSTSGWDRGDFSPLPGPASPATRRAIADANSAQTPQSYQSQRNTTPEHALRPTREWYLLLAGLLTRAVLEGYLTGGWRGSKAVECLLMVGLGLNAKGKEKGREREQSWREGTGTGTEDDDERDEPQEEEDEEEFAEFDPDDLPNLVDAVKVLFPSLQGEGARKDKAEEEFEVEMLERLRRFYDIPASTPDLSTHMEDLAWQYPAEPVERAAVRFCEAIAKWRGKPELETYKKKPPPVQLGSPGSTGMTIESLVHSNPTSPSMGNAVPPGGSIFGQGTQIRVEKKIPSIDAYFSTPPASGSGSSWGKKRARESDEGRVGGSKRLHA